MQSSPVLKFRGHGPWSGNEFKRSKIRQQCGGRIAGGGGGVGIFGHVAAMRFRK